MTFPDTESLIFYFLNSAQPLISHLMSKSTCAALKQWKSNQTCQGHANIHGNPRTSHSYCSTGLSNSNHKVIDWL
uniref:Uncharacterized protein n=1 Tax=Anguilla anguilla TaxID=7936 RepID=A0A0E9UGT0_ANGAN